MYLHEIMILFRRGVFKTQLVNKIFQGQFWILSHLYLLNTLQKRKQNLNTN